MRIVYTIVGFDIKVEPAPKTPNLSFLPIYRKIVIDYLIVTNRNLDIPLRK